MRYALALLTFLLLAACTDKPDQARSPDTGESHRDGSGGGMGDGGGGGGGGGGGQM